MCVFGGGGSGIIRCRRKSILMRAAMVLLLLLLEHLNLNLNTFITSLLYQLNLIISTQ